MHPRKILAIKLRAMGDTVLMTAAIDELKRAYPESEIHLAVISRWVPLLENHPSIHRIWGFDRHENRAARAKAAARLALKLRKERYDCVINFHASPTSSMIAFATGAPVRSIHFHGHKDKNRYSTVTIPGKGMLKPVIERDMDALRALKLHIPPGRMPRVPLTPVELLRANEWLSDAGLKFPVLGISLGASRPTKCWPVERFAQLAVHWCQAEGGSVLALAGPEEEATLHTFLKTVDDFLLAEVPDSHLRAQIRSRIGSELNLPLRLLAAISSRLSVFAGNDSGPRHIATAAGAPTVTIFGPEHPFEWHPYPTDRHPYFFIDGLECRKDAHPGMPAWCGLERCETEKHRCMQMIGVDAVLEACRKVAKRGAPPS